MDEKKSFSLLLKGSFKISVPNVILEKEPVFCQLDSTGVNTNSSQCSNRKLVDFQTNQCHFLISCASHNCDCLTCLAAFKTLLISAKGEQVEETEAKENFD